MIPQMRTAGVAGMVAGVLLVLETTSFLLSGWSPEKFSDPARAIELLREGGAQLRVAAMFGFAGLLATTFLVAGLASALRNQTPSLAVGTLYFGLIGIAGHSLVPLGLWVGVPAFLTLASRNTVLAQSAWAAFGPTSDTAHGVGTLFMGASMVLAGSAIIASRGARSLLGWVAVAAGALTLATLLTVGTSLAAFGGVLFMPALALTVVFRFWAGLSLWRRAESPESESR
jgi:hypothetical protein